MGVFGEGEDDKPVLQTDKMSCNDRGVDMDKCIFKILFFTK
jgi:hypothetical protein